MVFPKVALDRVKADRDGFIAKAATLIERGMYAAASWAGFKEKGGQALMAAIEKCNEGHGGKCTRIKGLFLDMAVRIHEDMRPQLRDNVGILYDYNDKRALCVYVALVSDGLYGGQTRNAGERCKQHAVNKNNDERPPMVQFKTADEAVQWIQDNDPTFFKAVWEVDMPTHRLYAQAVYNSKDVPVDKPYMHPGFRRQLATDVFELAVCAAYTPATKVCVEQVLRPNNPLLVEHFGLVDFDDELVQACAKKMPPATGSGLVINFKGSWPTTQSMNKGKIHELGLEGIYDPDAHTTFLKLEALGLDMAPGDVLHFTDIYQAGVAPKRIDDAIARIQNVAAAAQDDDDDDGASEVRHSVCVYM